MTMARDSMNISIALLASTATSRTAATHRGVATPPRGSRPPSPARNKTRSGDPGLAQGTGGKTWSIKCAARSAMRRPPQLGQNPRPLQGKGHEPIETARRTPQPREAARQKATPQKVAELLFHEPGQPFPVPQTGRLRAERLDVIADHLIEALAARVPRGESPEIWGFQHTRPTTTQFLPTRKGPDVAVINNIELCAVRSPRFDPPLRLRSVRVQVLTHAGQEIPRMT